MTGDAEGWLQCAQAHLARRDLAAAVAGFHQAELAGACADVCAGGRWTVHMLMGNFAAAWGESDSIRRRGAPDPHRFWSGEDPGGRRVILRCLHGCGDSVQFLRYVPRLRELAAHLVVEAQPAMVEIVRCFDGVDAVTTWDAEATAASHWDLQIEITELPYLFRTDARDLPLTERYLRLPAAAQSDIEQAMGSSHLPRIGVVWAAGDWNISRSLPFDLLQPLLECSQWEFWNLQGGTAWKEWNQCHHKTQLRDAADGRKGILPLAATISQLDLLITVDTLAAHLAGAMGKPAWLLLQHAADWRWMIGRNDTPWYPSLRLFRQSTQGDWTSVVRSVSNELKRWPLPQSGPLVAV